MNTEQAILEKYNGAPLLSIDQLAEVLHRSKDGLRISLSGDNEVSRKFLPCKVRIGRSYQPYLQSVGRLTQIIQLAC